MYSISIAPHLQSFKTIKQLQQDKPRGLKQVIPTSELRVQARSDIALFGNFGTGFGRSLNTDLCRAGYLPRDSANDHLN